MSHHTRSEAGMALIEALMASAVLGIGMLGAIQLALTAFQASQDSRQRAVAQMLAQEAMDCATVNRGACTLPTVVNTASTRFTRQISTTPRGSGDLFDVKVTVSWPSTWAAKTTSGTSEVAMDWHSSYAQVPTWVGVSLP
ncbi:type IV pilus modification PilV family protein [Limnohabitans lacus]|jgi:Tfp pilus assembly protein PilV|uniref:Type IV pilus modification protein PilV n=1 Tax=Limnohabitans lacus TaxID=3045173 RepID=A0ABT6X5R6_9BURK|nr:hypothetical protein [Limnohabitans sp. HM2-2]MDI9233401.1 hypothetical protein [Limnohabitans sp. HM2-2]